MAKTRQEILEALKQNRDTIRGFGVRRLGLFPVVRASVLLNGHVGIDVPIIVGQAIVLCLTQVDILRSTDRLRSWPLPDPWKCCGASGTAAPLCPDRGSGA
jgi:hypothetical protein